MPVIKILTHKRKKFEYLLRYMMDDDERLFDSDGKSFVIRHNIRGTTIGEWTKSFIENEKYRLRKRSNSVYVNHEIISFHRDDTVNLTQAKLRILIRKYIELRNPRGCYVAVPHYDRFHVHIHICSSAIENGSGKSMRLSRNELSDLKHKFQQFQIEKYPELKSIVNHRSYDKSSKLPFLIGQVSTYELIQKTVKECRTATKSDSDFYQLLQVRGLITYMRGGKVYGVIHNNRKYRFRRLLLNENSSANLRVPRNRNYQSKYISRNTMSREY